MRWKPTPPIKFALIGPREEPFNIDPDLEYREQMVRSYAEIFSGIKAAGTDYTVSREFLGIEYLASSLRRRGAKVLVISANNEDASQSNLLDTISEFEPDIVGISLLYDIQLVSALMLARDLKRTRPSVYVVFGGPLASAIGDLLLETFPFVDGVVKGEGEEAAVALAEAIGSGGTLEGVPSLVHRRNGSIVENPRSSPVDLDLLPHPSRDVIASLLARNLPVPSAYLTMSRGCKAFCTFCTVPQIVRGMKEHVYRMRNPVDVVDEIEQIVETYGVRRFYMADDNFLGYGQESNQRMLEFADEIIRRKLSINFHAECRVDSLVPATLIRLRQAGFDQILFGLESGSQKTLRRWAKGQTVAQNEAAIALARELKLDLMPSMILLDWESSVDEVDESVSFIERNHLYTVGQPLWLVNKLKVHCGTAAARRYDNVRGKPAPPAVDDREASMRNWAAVVTYQGTTLSDPQVAEFWKALNQQANRWTYLLDQIVPSLLAAVRAKRHHLDAEQALAIVSRLGLMRRSVGRGLSELMRILIDESAHAQRSGKSSRDLTGLASSAVQTFEASVLGADFATFLLSSQHELERTGAVAISTTS